MRGNATMSMTQRTLYKTIEKIGSRSYASEDEMLRAILVEIVKNDRINIVGGRIWKLVPGERAYELVVEEGAVEPVGAGFRLRIGEYSVFDAVARQRTVLSSETDRTLRSKGIRKYSATGIGETVRLGRTAYYEFLMAFNTVTSDTAMVYTLNIASQAMTQLLEARRRETEKRILESEMEHAAALQQQILPPHEYRFGTYELYGMSLPERIVGGDFFNYHPVPGDAERMAVSIGDAASKGLPAAVQALFVSGALMMGVEFESKISSMLRRVNSISRRIFPTDRLVSLFYCELFRDSAGLVLYANAGHPYPIHYHAATRSCSTLAVTGPIIGLLPDARFNVNSCTLQKNDLLLLYTDGITEASTGEEEFGEQRLMELVRAHAAATPKVLCAHIVDAVQQYGVDGPYADDKTLVAIKRTK
jgi:phosphoserine phosphatase RsbU/P